MPVIEGGVGVGDGVGVGVGLGVGVGVGLAVGDGRVLGVMFGIVPVALGAPGVEAVGVEVRRGAVASQATARRTTQAASNSGQRAGRARGSTDQL